MSIAQKSKAMKLDQEWLTSLGFESLPPDAANELLQFVYGRLEMATGMRLARSLTSEQLEEFEQLMDNGDEPGGIAFLETTLPNFRDVVAAELELLGDQLRSERASFTELFETERNG